MPGGELDEDGDGRLVVGAEDRLAAAAKDAVRELDLDLPALGHGVEMGEEGHPALAGARDARDQVAGAGPCPPGGVVLDHVDPERAQLGDHVVGDRALVAGRARDLAEAGEALVETPVGLVGAVSHRSSSPASAAWAAATRAIGTR